MAYGTTAPIMQFISQLRADAKPVALSSMISDMYSHVIGPLVNSKTIMKSRTPAVDGIPRPVI